MSLPVVLHCHSVWSYDGHWQLSRIARVFGRLGVRAVMMTEHDTGFAPERFAEYRAACAQASTARCTLIPGIEYSCPDNDVHILTWGLQDFLAEHRPVIDTLKDVRAAGGVAIFAHPIRREAFKLFQPDWVPYLAGIELWNRKSDGITWGPEAWDLIQQTGLPATVGMDFHKPRHFYPLINRMPVQAGPTLEADLVAALANGQQQPRALGLPLLRNGRPRHQPFAGMETLRRGLRDMKHRFQRRA